MHHDKFTVNISGRVLLALNSITILFFYCKKLYNYIKLKVKTKFASVGGTLSSLLSPLSSHTLYPLSSVYKVAHVRSGVRRRVRARSGTGGSLLTFCLRLFCCCLFLSKSSSIYSRIWISDLAPGSSPLERSNGSGGDSVSTGFVVRRWIGGSR